MRIIEIKYIKMIWDWFKSLSKLTQQIIIASIIGAWVCTFFFEVDGMSLVVWYMLFAAIGFVCAGAIWIIWNISADLVKRLNK